MITRHACRTRSYVRGYENNEYLKESSIGRILDHDYNTRERGPTETHRREASEARPLREGYYYTTCVIEESSRLY